jgi:hypothetical protein
MLTDAKVRAAKPRPKSYKLVDAITGVILDVDGGMRGAVPG